MNEQKPTQVILRTQKSVGTAILLAIFFGPLGMFYSTIGGAIIMMIVTPLIGIPTVGLGLLITQPICVIWAVIAVNSYNQKMISS